MLGAWTISLALVTFCPADDTWYPLGLTSGTTAPGLLYQMTHASPGVLTYTGAEPMLVDVRFVGTASIFHPWGYQELGVAIGHNGTPIESTRIDTLLTNPVIFGRPYAYATATQARIMMLPGDTIEVFVRNVYAAAAGPGVTYSFGYGSLLVSRVPGAGGIP